MALREILRSFLVTARHIGRRPVTYQFPEQKKEFAPRYHGRHMLNRYPDGLEKCIGCELCAWACPADAIFVVGADNTPEARFSPGERYGIDYQINYLRCIGCGLCIEACPTRALTMTNLFDLEDDSRDNLIYTKERLLAPLPSDAKPPPHTDEEVRARGIDYYGGYAATPYLTSQPRSEDAHDVQKRAEYGATPFGTGEAELERGIEAARAGDGNPATAPEGTAPGAPPGAPTSGGAPDPGSAPDGS